MIDIELFLVKSNENILFSDTCRVLHYFLFVDDLITRKTLRRRRENLYLSEVTCAETSYHLSFRFTYTSW
jgi:hypothetical protein